VAAAHARDGDQQLLRFAGDLDYATIGEAIGCSEVAARQNVRAGLATIRKGWPR